MSAYTPPQIVFTTNVSIIAFPHLTFFKILSLVDL